MKKKLLRRLLRMPGSMMGGLGQGGQGDDS